MRAKPVARYKVVTRHEISIRSKSICVKMPAGLIDAIDELVATEMFQNRSDVVREAVRRMIIEYSRKRDDGFRIGLR